MLPITFGSVGDIIAVVEPAVKLGKALSDTHGAPREYQDLIQELDFFQHALLEIDSFFLLQNKHRLQPSAENAIKRFIPECRSDIAAFLTKIEKYQESLRKGGSTARMKDSWRKIGWTLLKKDEAEKLCTTLNTHRANIMWLFSVSGVHALLTLSHSRKGYKLIVIGSSTSMQFIRDGMKENKDTLLKICDQLQDGFAYVQYHLEQIVRPVEEVGYPWQTDMKPVAFLDALGSKTVFPMELCLNPKAFDKLLKFYFRNKPSQRKVYRGQYRIYNGKDGHEISREEWKSLVVPGAVLDMSILVASRTSYECPGSDCRYHNTDIVKSGTGYICCRCSKWFATVEKHRITELGKCSLWTVQAWVAAGYGLPDNIFGRTRVTNYYRPEELRENSPFSGDETTEILPAVDLKTAAVSNDEESDYESDDDDPDISSFKRVHTVNYSSLSLSELGKTMIHSLSSFKDDLPGEAENIQEILEKLENIQFILLGIETYLDFCNEVGIWVDYRR